MRELTFLPARRRYSLAVVFVAGCVVAIYRQLDLDKNRGNRFECTGCGECCRTADNLFLTPHDVFLMARAPGLVAAAGAVDVLRSQEAARAVRASGGKIGAAPPAALPAAKPGTTAWLRSRFKAAFHFSTRRHSASARKASSRTCVLASVNSALSKISRRCRIRL